VGLPPESLSHKTGQKSEYMHTHERLERESVTIVLSLQRANGMAHTSLCDQLEREPAHVVHYVNLLPLFPNFLAHNVPELWGRVVRAFLRSGLVRTMYLQRQTLEHRDHPAHVVDGKGWVHELPLFAMHLV
jgi:hypothetical protein